MLRAQRGKALPWEQIQMRASEEHAHNDVHVRVRYALNEIREMFFKAYLSLSHAVMKKRPSKWNLPKGRRGQARKG